MSATPNSSSRSPTSSVFSQFSSALTSTNSSLSITPEPAPAATIPKRKYEREVQSKAPKKRRKAMGRPKNDWTLRRQRRLVRLYLMTNLEIEEIAKVLEARDFKPCKRDIQSRLNQLLQARPDKIRFKGPTTRKRLDSLRKCKALLNSRRMQKTRKREQVELKTDQDICGGSNTQDSSPVPTSSDWSWLDLGMNADVAFAKDDATLFSQVGLQDVEHMEIFFDYLETPLCRDDIGYLPAAVQESSQPPIVITSQNSIPNASPSGSTWPLPEVALDFGLRQESLPGFHNEGAEFPGSGMKNSDERNQLRPFDYHQRFSQTLSQPTTTAAFTQSDSGHFKVIDDGISISGRLSLSTSLHLPTESSWIPTAAPPTKEGSSGATAFHPMIQSAVLPEVSQIRVDLDSDYLQDSESMISKYSKLGSGGLSLKSLKRRLSFKYTDSYLGDVLSILEHFTISGSSAKSSASLFSRSKWGASRSSLISVQTTQAARPLPVIDEVQSPVVPAVMSEHSKILPGAFPRYCWKHLNENKLFICGHFKGSQKQSALCRPAEPAIYRSIRSDVFTRIVRGIVRQQDVKEVDTFGNSILHIAAALGLEPSYLMSLVKMTLDSKGDINILNNADQSFLHLIQAENVCENLVSLFDILKENGFNFNQHDHHGRTALHTLTRPWTPPQILANIVKKLDSINVIVPSTRDNMGRMIVEQLNDPRAQPPQFDKDRDVALLSLSCESGVSGGNIVHPIDTHRDDGRTKPLVPGDGQYRHYAEELKKGTVIETLEDLLTYERHSDLLKTILRAGHSPWFEDSRGRNGLHCLAEVSLDLPLETGSAASTLESKNDASARERYLENLLTAGVDPNNFDKYGNTPFMAFVIFSRGRDGASIMRTLQRLVKAKANIHRRNRHGETALHLAVKQGCREATTFLLTHNANVHARDNNGKGVLEIGHEHSMKAIHDAELYSQIVLCASLVAGAGAIPSPTVLDEWASPQWRIQRV